MKTTLRAIVTAIFLLAGETVSAQKYKALGQPDCNKWINEPSIVRKGWLLGYLSGLNAVTAKPGFDPLDKLSSAEQAFAWMDNYCSANPLELVGSGAVKLYLELAKKK